MTTKRKQQQLNVNKASKSARKEPSNPSKAKSEIDGELGKNPSKEALVLLRGWSDGGDAALEQARKVIKRIIVDSKEAVITPGDKVLFLFSCVLSIRHVPGYATLDQSHLKNINMMLEKVKNYIADTSQKRPLNFLMLASPGAGKSHFIKSIAASLQANKVGAITFNMAGLQRNEDLMPPLDAARNLKVEDRIPLLFLDEFDSDKDNIALLLPLLWDGELNLGQRDLKLGKVIIVLAGSDPSMEVTMNQARSMRHDALVTSGQTSKIIDLLSRINGGVIPIPPFYDPSREIDRRVDKVCVATQLLRYRFGQTLKHIPVALLRFLARTEFRYGVRSIAHLIDLIPFKKDIKVLKVDDLKLPIDDPAKLKESSLAYHLLHDDQAHGVSKTWEEVSISTELLPVSHDIMKFMQVGAQLDEEFLPYLFHNIVNQIHITSS